MSELLSFGKLRMGDRLGPLGPLVVTREALVDMAAVLHDPNPIHMDTEVARAQGFPDLIQQGPLTESFCFHLLSSHFGPHRIRHVQFRLLGNVFLGDRLYYKGEITQKTLRKGEQHVSCHLWVERHDATVVLRGSADITLF